MEPTKMIEHVGGADECGRSRLHLVEAGKKFAGRFVSCEGGVGCSKFHFR
jgi:hypothetical protein